MATNANIKWYRTKVDKDAMSALRQRSDARGLAQALGHIALLCATGTLTYVAWAKGWWGLMVLGLILHGSFFSFMGLGGAGHELCHKTVFKSQWLNDFFLRLSSFMGWFNYPMFIASHVKHHQYTLHAPDDLEVVLPAKLNWYAWVYAIANPVAAVRVIYQNARLAMGIFKGEWENKLINGDIRGKLRRDVMRCSRNLLLAHALLAAIFIATEQWILLLLVTFAPFYAGWLNLLMAFPQHAGLVSHVPDFRLACRTFVANPFFNFLYWQMNYHTEHHMFPGVPCHNLKRLRQMIDHDMPPANRGLFATWREIASIMRRQKVDPNYAYAQPLPQNSSAEHETSSPLEVIPDAV